MSGDTTASVSSSTSNMKDIHSSSSKKLQDETHKTSKFYVLSVLTDTPYRERVEYWCRNNKKDLQEIYANEPWMKDRQTNLFLVEIGKKDRKDAKKLRKVYDTDLTNIHICKYCEIFYLTNDNCKECSREVSSINE